MHAQTTVSQSSSPLNCWFMNEFLVWWASCNSQEQSIAKIEGSDEIRLKWFALDRYKTVHYISFRRKKETEWNTEEWPKLYPVQLEYEFLRPIALSRLKEIAQCIRYEAIQIRYFICLNQIVGAIVSLWPSGGRLPYFNFMFEQKWIHPMIYWSLRLCSAEKKGQ